MKPILAFIGPSGAGKTSLLMALAERRPNHVDFLRSCTSREPRNNRIDRQIHQFYSHEEMRSMIDRGKIPVPGEYAGNYYGCHIATLEALLPHRMGAVALIPAVAQRYREKGYEVVIIQVLAMGRDIETRGNEARIEEDQKMATAVQVLNTDLVIENDFGEGGFERSMNKLCAFIDRIIDTGA